MRTKYKSKVTRTSGWQSDPEFDKIISDLDVSSLAILNDKYKNDIRDYPRNFDLSNPKYKQFYKVLLQHKKMIVEEIDEQIRNRDASPTYQGNDIYFDAETGLVMKYSSRIDDINDGEKALYSIAYNEDESDMIYNNSENTAGFFDDSKEEISEPKTLKELYAQWDYTENIDE